MTVLRRRRRRHNYPIATLIIAAIILVSIAAILAAGDESAAITTGAGMQEEMRIRRRLVGSWPPACRGSCGRCRPCKAVRVTIHPGVSVPLDYYPEAWRCKCRNKLFLP